MAFGPQISDYVWTHCNCSIKSAKINPGSNWLSTLLSLFDFNSVTTSLIFQPHKYSKRTSLILFTFSLLVVDWMNKDVGRGWSSKVMEIYWMMLLLTLLTPFKFYLNCSNHLRYQPSSCTEQGWLLRIIWADMDPCKLISYRLHHSLYITVLAEQGNQRKICVNYTARHSPFVHSQEE